jgi:hypothetical protein
MKTPNVLSLLVILGLILPAVATAITQQFPADQYWWAALVTFIIGGAVKAIEVWVTQNRPLPPNGAAMEAAPRSTRSGVSEWLAG